MHLLEFLEECEGGGWGGGWLGGRARARESTNNQTRICFIDYCCAFVLDGRVHTVAGLKVTLEQILIFFTATDREPPLGFPKQPELQFLPKGILATASTCDLVLRLPTMFHNSYSEFREMLIESVVSSEGFGVA